MKRKLISSLQPHVRAGSLESELALKAKQFAARKALYHKWYSDRAAAHNSSAQSAA